MKTWMNRIGMALIAAAAAAMIAADGFAAEGAAPAVTGETGPASGQHLHRAEPAGDRSGPVSGRAG
ncbi:hypothetical protein DIE28_00665 [Paracoccus thiocyanatus]|uniref:Uncharacterized protein n=1 Tax=Paracoccus thiocyanatus TaxID=34006 RepID=A0A3D8PFF6_9RHOB|nr:hypothetical protein DIE28_00665 [Paracoccus thiocyanatus]